MSPDIGIEIDEQREYEWAIEKAIEHARECGFEVVRSSPDRILLDLDTGAAMDHFRRMLPKISGLFGLKEEGRWTSKSGVGTHVVVACKPMPFAQRIAIAAALGSDPLREALAIGMLASGIDEPSVLFKPGRRA